MSAIELKAVSKSWGDVVALASSSLVIPEGSFAVLLGPSGCGKSTTLRLIAGLDQPSGGEIWVNGKNVTYAPPVERDVAMVFQNYALFPHLTVADNVLFGMQVRKASKQLQTERLDKALTLLGLSALSHRKPAQLSGGQQQRVALARALVAEKPVCLMDEPLSNLDAQLRQEMRQELRELQQRLKLTVVYVTHDQAEAMSMADQVVLLNQGRIEQAATPRDIYAKPATMFAAKFIGTPPMSFVSLDSGNIRGTLHALNAPENAATLGIRPEDVSLSGHIYSVVESCEYLGADSVLRCRIGSQNDRGETVTVRALGQQAWPRGSGVRIGWSIDAQHWFDADGRRIEC